MNFIIESFHLFQKSFDSCEIPKEWTLANISPLFKKGDRFLYVNGSGSITSVGEERANSSAVVYL